MSSESTIFDSDGKPTHIRVTSEDGKTSTLHEYENGLYAYITGDYKGKAIEIADHNSDGTTDAYKREASLYSFLTGDFRGEKKNS